MEKMKRILFVAHSEADGSPLTWDFMRFHGVELETVKPCSGFPLPKDHSGFDGIVTMGVQETVEKDDFLDAEVELLRSALEKNTPILAISLGARLLAQACYSSWYKNEKRRADWSRVTLTQEGRRDILFYGLPASMNFFHVFAETLEMPRGALHLARSEECSVQAFRLANAYGLSFHIDVTPVMLNQWAKMIPEREKALRYVEGMKADMAAHARTIYGNFLWLIDICRSDGYRERKSGNKAP